MSDNSTFLLLDLYLVQDRTGARGRGRRAGAARARRPDPRCDYHARLMGARSHFLIERYSIFILPPDLPLIDKRLEFELQESGFPDL